MAEGLNAGGGALRGPAPIQRRANMTGLPDALKDGVESLSGLSLDDVRVHYNSPRPAQLQAHAYTRGTDIHLGPRQERHLPHEAWHVVQQKQGRVKPTLQLKGEAINDDRSLEAEADAMGDRAQQGVGDRPAPTLATAPAKPNGAPIQRRVGYEFETNVPIGNRAENLPNKQPFFQRPLWHAEPDRANIEFVTRPLVVEEEVVDAVGEIMEWGRNLLSLPILTLEPKGKVSDQPKQIELPELPDSGPAELVSKFGFTQEEAEELHQTYGPEVIANVVSGCTSKQEVLEFAPMIARYMTKSASPQKEKKVDPEEEQLLIERNSYRDLGEMDVPGEWLAQDLISKGREYEMTASPQVTIGTALEQIGEMMIAIPNTELNVESIGADGTFTGRDREAGKTMQEAAYLASQAVKSVRNDEASESEWRSLEGMLALMISYILTGQRAKKPFREAKNVAPLMSRVNFVAMYKALAPEPRKHLTPAFVAAAAGVRTDSPVFGPGFGKKRGGGAMEREAVAGPSVGAWVRDLAGGTDLMSSGEVVDRDVEGSPSMGEQTELDTEGSETGLVPLELRRIPGGVPLAQWLDFAVQAFELSRNASPQSRQSK